MPRPLYLLKTVTEQDPTQTREKIKSLCGESVTLSDKSLKCLALSLKQLTDIDYPSNSIISTVDLGVRIWNDLKVSNYLTTMGFYLQAIMVLRDVIETMAVIEYLHTFPKKAGIWWKAKTSKERRHFSINSIKGDIKDGHELKELWEVLSAKIHPNSEAVPIYGADKPLYGHYLFLGGFYYPSSVEYIMRLQLHFCILFTERLKDWHKDVLEVNSELITDIDSLQDEYKAQCAMLETRTEAETKEIVDKVVATRLSPEEVIEWFISLDNS